MAFFYIITFSHITPTPQSPSGGTSGLCLKKLNITTSSYRIIINRLDRKVNPSLIACESSFHLQDSTVPVHNCLSTGDGELQTCKTSLFPSLSLRGGYRQHVPDPDTWWGQHTMVSQHWHHGVAVHHHL